MEVIEEKGVKVINAVLISGITGTEVDEEILDFVKQYGSIHKTIPISYPSSESQESLITEFSSGLALQTLQTILPYVQQAKNNPDVSFHVTALSNVYVERLGRNTTQIYLNELKDLASRSGKNFEDVLKGMLAHMHEMVVPKPYPEPIHDEVNDTASVHLADPSLTNFTYKQSQATADVTYRSVPLTPAAIGPEPPLLTTSDLNPPGVQRVVVEHLVRSTDLTVHGKSLLGLRVFSGCVPHPPNEVDYETWRPGVELLLQDPTVSDFHRVCRICESLFSPAADIIKSVGLTASPSTYLPLLDSAFATIEDGDELFAKFLNIFQNPGEKPSAYLQRLHVTLQSALRQGGVLGSDVDKHLLKQFCRGCWESYLITELKLERKNCPLRLLQS